MTVYLDCNATTPIESAVSDLVMKYMIEEFGNAGSRTHEFGLEAKKAVLRAREQVARVVDAKVDEVFFTSGATESNNLALLGLAQHGESIGHKHIISSQIEHKAILEPLEQLQARGFEITLLPSNDGGWVEPQSLESALRDDTLLVSLMQVNNETGIIQACDRFAEVLDRHPAYFHTDAAQGYGKEGTLTNTRIDLISVSAHKVFGPKGVGALVARKRGYKRPPLSPLMFGGGQERGLRPGTAPVSLIAGFGLAAELAYKHAESRQAVCQHFREQLLLALQPLKPQINGNQARCVPHTLSVRFEGLDSEAVMLALKGVVAVSNGSACTSKSYEPSHVLKAMGLSEEDAAGTLRFSWCHLTEAPDWDELTERIKRLY